jgi:hypothetical protein
MRLPALIGFLFFHVYGVIATEPPLTPSNSWALAQPEDPFNDQAMVDLRYLNERQSGEKGFIRLSEDGNDFVLGDGLPVRFWSVGTDAYNFTPQQMDQHCRWLAKLGVNLTRLHVNVCNPQEGAKITDVDQKIMDGCYRFIKAAKDNGIYVIISPFYAHFDVPESWGLEGGKQRAEGLIFIDPVLQEAYQGWTRSFYTSVNPHTGLAIKEDATVAILQVHNEDSLFFWTEQNLSAPQKRSFGKQFAKWLVRKYGDLDKASTTWGDARKHEQDDLAGGVVGVFDVYFLTLDHEGGMAKRIRDQTQFMAEFQREFYANMAKFYRQDLGVKQLLNATNWRTANDEKLKALERFSYHALDIDAENEYVGSDYQHKGPNDGYRIDPGHFLVNESVLGKPFEMCTNWIQEEGHPFIVTETAWKNPNRYQSEGPFLAAAYQSLGGVDAICWFSCQTPRYELDPLKSFWQTEGQSCTHKWNCCYPAMMAGFPANALLYRKQYLKPAEVIVRMNRTTEEMWDRKIPPVSDNETYGDQRQVAELKPGWQPSHDEINRAVYQIGAVRSIHAAASPETQVRDFSEQFEPKNGEIRSSTGELKWNYRKEICLMDTPKAQGITGFLARNGGRFSFADVTIQTANDYATINVVSLDDQPIASSSRVLVQVVTVNRLTGFETKDAKFKVGDGPEAYEMEGEQIIRIGTPPFRIANTEVSLSFRNPKLTQAIILDINGYPIKSVKIENQTLRLPKDCFYAVVRSDETAK